MSTVLRRNRKGSDAEIIRKNSIGLSLATIARELNCHPTSVTLRLQGLNIPAADTRRAFMEDIYSAMPLEFQETIADILLEESAVRQRSIKDYVRDLLIRDVAERREAKTHRAANFNFRPVCMAASAVASVGMATFFKLGALQDLLPAFVDRMETFSAVGSYSNGLLS